MHRIIRALSISWAGGACALFPALATALTYGDIDSFVAPTNAAMMIYAPATNALVLKNAGSAIVAIDIASRQATTHLATSAFTDMSLAPSGRYVFAADYGGEHIGYGTPLDQSYVHRLDLTNMTWDLRTAYIAGDVAAVSDTQVILKSIDQWVTFTNNSWGSGTALIPLNTPSDPPFWGPGYYSSVYEGNFRYDVRTGRLLHGNTGDSSQEIQAFRIVNNEFVTAEGSGVYGSAQGYGPNVVLATDSSAFYYGALQVDPLNVAHNLRVFPERIYGANASVALGNGKYFDAHTGVLLGTLPFSTTVYALNPAGDDFWAYDPATTTVHHFVVSNGLPTSTIVTGSGSPSSIGDGVTFMATVAGSNPTGTVRFSADGGAPIAECSGIALDGSGNNRTASCLTISLGIGTHSIVANYAGDAGNAPSSTTVLWQVINTGASSPYTDVNAFDATPNATMMLYSPTMNALVLKDGGSAIAAIDISSRQPTLRFATSSFTDMSLAPSGRYVFAADYGGENIGYGTPSASSFVHRLDLTSMTWDLRTAYIAGNVQAVSDTQVILKSIDQWVTFTNNGWGSGTALVPLNTPTNPSDWGAGYYAGVYEGDFRYDMRTRRLLHGNTDLSSQEIQAFSVVNNQFVDQEGSGTYGSAQGYGPNVALATDGSAFYYGALQVDALDVIHNLHVFPERIYAANGSIALGNGKYYDAHSGLLLGTLPFSTTVYALNASGGDFWAYDPATSTVHHFLTSTNTTLTTSVSPALYDTPLVFTATITAASGNTPTGSVNFTESGVTIGNCGTSASSGNSGYKFATCSISSLAGGTHNIVATYSGDGSNAGSNSSPLPQQITPAPQTITFVTVSDRSLSDAPFTLSATASSGLAVSFVSQTATVCSVSGNTVSLVAAGICTIRTSQAGNASYNAAPDVDRSFNVSQGSGGPPLTNGGFETPNLGGSFQYTPGGATWTFSGGAGISGNDTGFTNGNPNAPEGAQVAFLQGAGSQIAQTASMAAGQYTLSLRAAQRGNYQVGTQTVQVQVDGVAVGQYQPPGTAYGTYQTTAFTIAITGNHTIALIAVGTGGDFTGFIDNVALNSNNTSPTTTTVTSTPNPATYGTGVTFTATVSAVSGNLPGGSVNFTEGGNTVGNCATSLLIGSSNVKTATCAANTLGGGTHNIVATYLGDGANAGSSSTPLAQSITAANQTIAFAALDDRTTSDAPFALIASASSGLAVSFSSQTTSVCSASGSTVTLLAAGICTIRASQAGNGNYNSAPAVDRSFNVSQGTASTPFSNGGFETPNVGGSFQYAPSGAAWTFAGGAGISGNDTGFTNGNPTAPEGTQVAFIQGAGSQIAQTAFIAAAQYTLSLRAAQRGNYQFGAQVFQLQVDGVTVGLYQPPSTAYGTYQTNAFTIAIGGNHTIALIAVGTGGDFTAFIDDVHLTPNNISATATTVGSAPNPAPYGTSVTLTATVTAAAGSTLTGGVNFTEVGVTIGNCGTSALNGSGNVKTATCSISTLSGGDHSVVATYLGDGANAGSSSSPLLQSVTRANQTIVFAALSDRTMSDTPFTVSATASSGLAVSFSSQTTTVCSVSGSTVNLLSTGTCTIRTSQAGNASYNAAPDVDRSFNVSQGSGGPPFSNGGFETPNLGGSFQYTPGGATWTFSGGAGISGNDTGFTNGNPNAPEGAQVAFLQGAGSQITQTASMAAGQYTLSLRAAQRGNYQVGTQTVQVQVDGVAVGQYQPPGTAYGTYQTTAFTIAITGNHTIALIAVGTGGDFTGFIDNVSVTASP